MLFIYSWEHHVTLVNDTSLRKHLWPSRKVFFLVRDTKILEGHLDRVSVVKVDDSEQSSYWTQNTTKEQAGLHCPRLSFPSGLVTLPQMHEANRGTESPGYFHRTLYWWLVICLKKLGPLRSFPVLCPSLKSRRGGGGHHGSEWAQKPYSLDWILTLPRWSCDLGQVY